MILAALSLDMAGEPDDSIARLRRGEPEAVGAAVSLYQHRLYRFLLRMVQEPAAAEDLFQLTWVRVMEKIGTYDARNRFETWLFTVAHNLAIDYLRRKRGVSLDAPDESGFAPVDRLTSSGADPLARLLDFERGAVLAAAMGELPPIHREVLTLRFEEEMKLEEIAEVAGIPLSTVKSRLRRALEGLRVKLSEGQGA